MLTPTQFAILNSLVTYAAENVPNGLTDEELEIVKIVGKMAAEGGPPINPNPSRLDFTLDELVSEVLKLMSENKMIDHYDAYGGAMFVLDLREVLKQVYANRGLKFKEEEPLGA